MEYLEAMMQLKIKNDQHNIEQPAMSAPKKQPVTKSKAPSKLTKTKGKSVSRTAKPSVIKQTTMSPYDMQEAVPTLAK